MKLRKFRTLEDKINLGLKIFCCLLILTIIVMGKSFAEYKQEAEVTFIRARVGKFKTNDIQLAMLLDGEEVETPPSKDNYTVDISCDNADGSWDSDRWGANIDNIRASKVKCEVNFTTPAPTMSEVTATSEKTSIALSYTITGANASTTCKYGTTEWEYSNTVENATNTSCNINGLDMDTLYYYQVCAKNGAGEVCKEGNIKTKPNSIGGTELLKNGDYISMTPTSTSYTISGDLTGYGSDQTINPSELNLWRVIKKNDDGTVDVVSEYVTNEKIWFAGKNGYKNFISSLNIIASQYFVSGVTVGARIVGFSNQVGTCATESLSDCPQETPYTEDLNLIKSAIGSINAKSVDGEKAQYWLPGRSGPKDYTNSSGKTYKTYSGFHVSTDVEFTLSTYIFDTCNCGLSNGNKNKSVRPIVVLGSTVEVIAGEGSSSSPYVLS